MKFLSTLSLSCFCLLVATYALRAEENPFELPAAQNAFDKYSAAVLKISNVLRDEQTKLLRTLKTELGKEKADFARKGKSEDLQASDMILANIDTTEQLLKDQVEMPAAPIDVGGDSVVSQSTSRFERAMGRADEDFRRDKTRLLGDYIKSLTAAKKMATQKMNTEEADRVQEALEAAKEEQQTLKNHPPRGGRDITISGKDGLTSVRATWGPLKKGRTIRMQYMSGKWCDVPQGTPASPDDLKVGENTPRVQVCSAEEKELVVLGDLPPGTARRPFSFVAPKDFSMIVFNNKDTKADNNIGEVVYRVWIEY